MFTLQEIRIKRVLPGPDACFVSAGIEDWQTEFHFIVQSNGAVHGRTNANQWVEVSQETRGIVRERVRQYLAEVG